ncbi:MAG: methyltransferase domain-containing protein [Candidatus Omnitrophica bacterium]|nr:methyltransferase domain-containing protein [Candidatus Omnitrophota bacterium]
MNTGLAFFKKTEDIKNKSFKRFNDWSRKYDRSILQNLVFRRSHDMFIDNMGDDKSPARVLDVGCGTGEFALKLRTRKENINLSGVDLSSEMINAAKEKFLTDKNVDFRIGEAGNMPYEDNSFDYITCSHSFHHYPNKRKTIREMYRVLRGGGKLMIVDGYKDSPRGSFIFDFIVRRHEIDVHHLHSKQFHRIMTRAGFRNITQKVFNPVIPLLFTMGVAEKEKSW